jgi:creatinine amidohydrolase
MNVWLQNMKWEEVEKALTTSNGVALIPVGSTEQHGKHLPLGTDSFAAIGLANDVGERTGAVVTPPIWFGWSPHHMWLPGTISLKPETLIGVVVDVCKSLVHHGFNKLVVINGHRMANLPPLQIACGRVQHETEAIVKLVDPYPLSEEIRKELKISELGHGDDMETSHMLFLHPELCEMDKVVKYIPSTGKDRRDSWIPHKLPTGEESNYLRRETAGTGRWPENASKENGKIIHNAVVDGIVRIIEDLCAHK